MPFSTTALLAIAGCALAYSGLDLLRKVLAGKVRAMPLLALMTLGSAPLFAVWVAVEGSALGGRDYLLPGLVSIALNIVANLAMLRAVRVSPLSVTIPLLSLTPVFTTLLAIPILAELPSGREWTGILLVVAGALMLNVVGLGGGDRPPLLRSLVREPGTLLMVLTALCWSLAMPLDKLAMDRSSPAFHGFALNLGIGVAVVGLMLVAGRLRELDALGRHAGLLTTTILVGGVALAFQLIAMTMVDVGLVETLKRAVGNLLAVILGGLAFREAVTGGKILAVLVMAAGVGLIVWQ